MLAQTSTAPPILCRKCHHTQQKPRGHPGKHVKRKKKPKRSSSDTRNKEDQGGRPKRSKPLHPTPPSDSNPRQSLPRTAKYAEKATHEVAQTYPEDPHPASFHGAYEPCTIVDDRGLTLTVKIHADGQIISDVPKHLVRALCFAHTQKSRPSRANPRQAKGGRHALSTSTTSKNRRLYTGGNNPFTSKYLQQVVRLALDDAPTQSNTSTSSKPTEANRQIIQGAVTRLINDCGGSPTLVAAAVDVLATNTDIQQQSFVTQETDHKFNMHKKKKQRASKIIAKENKKTIDFYMANAHILDYWNARLSQIAHEAHQRAQSLEPIGVAMARKKRKRIVFFDFFWTNRNYKSEVLGMERRLWNLLKAERGASWRHTGKESNLDGLLQSLGIEGTKDKLFDDVKIFSWDMVKMKWKKIRWDPPKSFGKIRGQFIKQIIRKADVVGPEWWDKDPRLRRKHVSKIRSYAPKSYIHGRDTWKAIEDHPAPFYDHGHPEYLYSVGNGPFDALNPTLKYEGDLMHAYDFVNVAHGMIELWYQRGDLKEIEVDDLPAETQQKMVQLCEMGVPTYLSNSKLDEEDDNFLYVPRAAREVVHRLLSLFKDSDSIDALILKLVKTFGFSSWQDNGDLMGRESLNANINRIMFKRRHFKDNLPMERLAQIRYECLTPTLTSLGKCTSEQLSFQFMLQSNFHRCLPRSNIPYHPGHSQISVTAEEARAWRDDRDNGDGGDEATQTTTPDVENRTGYTLQPEKITGDGEALQSAVCQQCGSGDKNDPYTKQSRADKMDGLVSTLLADMRTMKECADAYDSAGLADDNQALNTASANNGGFSSNQWKMILKELTGEIESNGTKASKKARAFLEGVTVKPGPFKGWEKNDPLLKLLALLDVAADPMHDIANVTKHALLEIVARFKKRYPASNGANTARLELFEKAWKAGGHRSSMTFRDWHNLNMYIIDQVDNHGLAFEADERQFLFYTMHLHRLIYTHSHIAHQNSRVIMSLRCVTVLFAFYHKRLFHTTRLDGSITRKAFHGYYPSTLIMLCLRTVQLAEDLETVNADWLEAALKWPKVMLLCRSNMRFNDAVKSGLLRRVCLAKKIFDENHKAKGNSNKGTDFTHRIYNAAPTLHPVTDKGNDDRKGEFWYVPREVVHDTDMFFIVAMLQSGWATMTTQNDPFWTNDNGFVDHTCGVTFNCVEEMEGFRYVTGSVMTGKDLSLLELIDAYNVLSERHERGFPGWESVAHVKAHLFAGILAQSDRPAMRKLHAWLEKVECPNLPDLLPVTPPNNDHEVLDNLWM